MRRFAALVLALAACEDGMCTGADCIPHRQPGLRYAVELAPPQNSALVREQFAELVTDADGQAALTFDAPSIVSGRVFVADSGTPSVGAHISAVLASDPVIPGHALVFDTDAATGVNLGATSFRLALPPGSYNLFVTPTAPDLPPVVVPVTVTGDHLVDVVLPGMPNLFKVDGRIYDPIGQGVGGMAVQVEQNGRRVSTLAVSDGGGGFTLWMPRAAGSYKLRAQPLQNSSLVAPALEQALALDGQSSQAQPILRMPSFGPPGRYHFTVQARSIAGLRAPVPGAQLAFKATIPDPDTPATFSVSATTDLFGGLDVSLIPNVQYTITVQTSPSSDYASAVLEHFSLDQSLDLELGMKTEVTGTVVGADGKTVGGAVIQALGISQTASQSGANNTSPTGAGTTQTDAQGRFRLVLDPGTYDLEAAPQDGSSYPRWALQGIVVGATKVPVTIQLPTASRIEGRVSGPDGRPQEADVRIFLVTEFGGHLGGRLRGQAHAGPDGSFQLVLANPQLPQH